MLGAMPPSPERFAALARSSPWLWHSLQFTAAWQGRPYETPVRAWVRRPGKLRVEDLAGALLHCGQEPSRTVTPLTRDGRGAPVALPDPRTVPPERDADGLVLRRPDPFSADLDDPLFGSYHWVAMLDPAELADGEPELPGKPSPAPVQLRELQEVDHHGRTAWEALVRTTEAYDPRCPCCALLPSIHSALREARERSSVPPPESPSRYATEHRVRLDAGTGVCVFTEEIGGPHPGTGHELWIEAVDEQLPDGLFVPPPRPRWWRQGRWRRRGRRGSA